MDLSAGGNDRVLGATTFLGRVSQDNKTASILTLEEGAVSENTVNNERLEPVTSRWELWSWYLYSFGNNSAGTLSYAPLSMFIAVSLNALYLHDSSLPVGFGPSGIQWE